MAEKKIIYDKEGKDTGEVEGPDTGWGKFILRQGAIGLADTPGSFAGLYGLGRAGAEYLWDRRIADTEHKPKDFAQTLLDPDGGAEKLKQYDQQVFEHIQRTRPDYTPEEVNKRFEHIQKHSKKYYEDTTPFYRQGMAFARKWGQKTNEFFGDERLPGEKTQADTLMNIAGGALIPVPGEQVLGPIASGVSKVAGKTAGKVATNALEFTTPVTFLPKGTTAGGAAARIGANIAIPEAVDQGVRAYKGDPSFVVDSIEAARNIYAEKAETRTAADAVKHDLLNQTKDDGSNTGSVVGAAGFFATLLGARRLRNVPSAGPTTQAMSDAAYPTVSKLKMGAARAGSDVEPFRVVAKEQGLTGDELESFMTEMRMNAGNNATADHRAWDSMKVSPIVEKFVREDPAFQAKFIQHSIDADRIRGDVDALAKSNDLMIEAQNALNKATGPRGRSTPQRIQELTDEFNARRLEHQARIADSDPNLRYSMMNEDRATVAGRLAQSRQDPRIRAVEQQFHRLYDDPFDFAVQNSVLSAAEGQRLKLSTRMGNYHLTENPLAQKNWFQRAGTRMMQTTEGHILNSNPEAVLGLYRMANRAISRRGYMDPDGKSIYTNPGQYDVPHPRTNSPRNPWSELRHVDLRVRQAVAHNNARRQYTEMVLGSKNYNPRQLRIVDKISEKDITTIKLQEIERKVNKNKGPDFYYTYRTDNGSLYLVRHNERAIHEALKFAPAVVVPIMNQARKVVQAFITGFLNPDFIRAVSVPFDVIIGGLARHSHMAYGPMSRLAANTFGVGHPLTRIFSALGAGIDIPYNLTLAMPFTAARALSVELVLGQLAKKWEADLSMNSGTISSIANMVGGRQALLNATTAMSKAYDATYNNLIKQARVGHVSSRSDDLLARLNEIDAVVKKRPFLRSVANTYIDLLNIFADVPKMMAMSQNTKIYRKEIAKGRQMAAYMNEKFIADQAAMIGGDMRRISGSRWVQGFTSMVPWSNTFIQSMRYMKQRLFNGTKADSIENATRMISFGVAASWGYYMISRDKEASDWFYNQLPNEKRTQNIPVPNFFRWAMRSVGVPIPVGTPEQEYDLHRMPPEAMMFILPIIHGARALGVLPSEGIVVPPSLKEDMAQAAEQTFGLAVPPLIQSVAGLGGKKLEPSKLISGGSAVREIRDVSFGGANSDKMSPQSRIPHAYYDAITALGGTVLGSMLEAANYGLVTAEHQGKTVMEGVTEGVKKLGVAQIQKVPFHNYIWPDVNRTFIYTPITEKLQHNMAVLKIIEKQMSAEPGVRRVVQPNARINNTEKTGALPGAMVGAPVEDVDVRAIMAQLHMGLFAGPYKMLEDQRRVERARHESLTIGPNPNKNDSPLTRFKMAQEQAKKVNALDRRLYTIYEDQWKNVVTSPSGLKFAERYGELTPENLAKVIQGDARAAGQKARPQPR